MKANEAKIYIFVVISSTIKVIQSISKCEPSHCRFTKTLNRVLLTLQKDKFPDSTSTGLNDIQTCRHLQKTRYEQADDQVLPIFRDKAMT